MLTFIPIALIIVWSFLHGRYTRTRQATPTMLFTEPRQCVQGFKRLANARHKAALEQWHSSFTLPALTEEDRL